MSKVAVGVVGVVLAAGVAIYFLVGVDKTAATTLVVAASPGPERNTGAGPSRTNAQVETPSPSVPTATEKSQRVGPNLPAAPLPIRPEFDAVFKEHPEVALSHAAMEREPRDPAWASLMEDRYRRAFAANRDLYKYGVPSAECRATYCEIQMLAYGAPQMERTQWGSLLGKGLMDTDTPNVGDADAGTPTDFTFGHKVVDGTTVLVFNVSFARNTTRK